MGYFSKFLLGGLLIAQLPNVAHATEISDVYAELPANSSTLEFSSGDSNRIRFEDARIQEGFFDTVERWTSLDQVNRAYEFIRSHAFLKHERTLRRINWLEPADRSCFQRGGIAAGLLKQHGFPLVTSIYLAGGFSTCSAFRDGSGDADKKGAGCVLWEWHNAPGVRVGNEVYILDPALNYARPLTLKEWVESNYYYDQPDLYIKAGMDHLGDEPYFNQNYGYRSSNEDDSGMMGAFMRGYLSEEGDQNPLNQETRKVMRFHSESLLFGNPPWLGLTADPSWKVATPKTKITDTCASNQSEWIVSKEIDSDSDEATKVRVLFSSEIQSLQDTVISIKNSAKEVIHYHVGMTANDDGSSRAALGSQAFIEFRYPKKTVRNCKDAIQKSNQSIKAIEVSNSI